MENIFKTLNDLDVSERIEKKQGLSYLSWAWAWSELCKKYPDSTYSVWRDEGGRPYTYDSSLGYMVYVSVTVKDITHSMWLPVMDGANKAQRNTDYDYETRSGTKTCKAATMFDINTAIMRCLVKCLAMFGLGIYIYAGEDLPEATLEENELLKFKGAVLERLEKFPREAIRLAFEESGYISEIEDDKKMLCALIKQVNTKEKLTTIGTRCKSISKELGASDKEKK